MKIYEFLVSIKDNVLIINQDKQISYEKVMGSPHLDQWLEAMKFEIQSMYQNQVWTLVDPHERV